MSGQSSYYARAVFFFFFHCGLQIRRDLWYGGSEGFWWPSIFLDFVTVGHFCRHILSCPSILSETMLFICSDNYLQLQKKKNRLLSKSVQVWSLSKSKAWAEAYNGLEFLEEAAFFHSLSPLPVIFVILEDAANLNQFKTTFEMPFDMPLYLV